MEGEIAEADQAQRGGDADTASATGREAVRPARVAFLCYLNRSGSTLLARLLDERRDVAVSLESGVRDGIVLRGPKLRTAADVGPYLDRAFAEPKFKEWGVDRAELQRRLKGEQSTDGVGFPAFLRHSLELALGERGAVVHVYKVSRYWERMERLRQSFPDARVVFVIRDLRAVYASQARSLDSRKGRPMARFPGLTARVYRANARVLHKFRNEPWLHVVRYEDLVANPDEEVDAVLDFLGVGRARRAGGSDYAGRIPEAQQHLHGNVKGDARTGRIEAWRTDVDAETLELLERIAGEALAQHGYPVTPRPAASVGMRWRQLEAALLYGASLARDRVRFRPWPWNQARRHDR